MPKFKTPNTRKNRKTPYSRNKEKLNANEEYDSIINGIFNCELPALNLSPSANTASDEEYRLSVGRFEPMPFDHYERKYNYLKLCTLEKAHQYARQYYQSFIGQGGLPTKSYKKLLTRVIQRLVKFNESQLYQLQLFFFSWDANEALTGMFRLTSPPDESDPNYLETDASTHRIVESIIQYLHAEQDIIFYNPSNRVIELSNSLITHLIKLMMLKKREGLLSHNHSNTCSYGNSCYRNPIHQLTVHSPFLRSGGSRKTRKRNHKN